MMNCAMNIIGLPATIPTEGLELRVTPRPLTAEILREFQEAAGTGRFVLLDEMNIIHIRKTAAA